MPPMHYHRMPPLRFEIYLLPACNSVEQVLLSKCDESCLAPVVQPPVALEADDTRVCFFYCSS